MTIEIKNLTVKNFMSVGNATQAVHFDRNDLTLVLGENLDLGGNGSRNGTGKTTVINALSYALFGQALTNIKRDNLINKTNQKNMLVSVDFSVDDTNYRIERGRKPNLLKFYRNNETVLEDNAQGENRETQQDIETALGLSVDMFKHIVALNTYTEPFLNLKAADQRDIIEQLLGITLLTEKSESLKQQIKEVKNSIKEEEFRIKAVTEANQRIEEQIVNLKKRQTVWLKTKQDDINKLQSAIKQLEHIDIDAEIQKFRELEQYLEQETAVDNLKKQLAVFEKDHLQLTTLINSLNTEIAALNDHVCYACGQSVHDSKQNEIKEAKQNTLDQAVAQLESTQDQIDNCKNSINSFGELGTKPDPFYSTLESALEHRNTVNVLQLQLDQRTNDADPYKDQIDDMQKSAVQEINYDNINAYNNLLEHQEFLLKLLTNKDSFIRKSIIDQNLSYLNSRLSHYLERIGLSHQVVFLNDLSVEITDLGRDLDFDNLSRGERNRLILSLSWAFRDVWESLYKPINLLFIDELVDSGMDTIGTESALSVLKSLVRERAKSVWLVSHKDELIGRVNNTLNVIKENGFTTYSTDDV